MPDTHRTDTARRHGNLPVLVALALLFSAPALRAGGGWVREPGSGGIWIGYNWKYQPDAQRHDTEGDLYRSLFNMTHDYRFLYLSGEFGIVPGLEGTCLFTYLWASEMVDSTSEDPSRHYHGFSDMWLGLKYQLWGGAFPTAVSATVRLPWLYEAASVRNGQLLTEIPGLLERDYDLNLFISHSFDAGPYASASLGFRFKEGAATHQILTGAEFGGALPFADDRIFAKVALEGVFSVGQSRPTTSRDRFSGLSLERGTHFFNFNDASYVRPQIGLSCRVIDGVDIGAGYSYIVWGHSTIVYQDILVQLGYSF